MELRTFSSRIRYSAAAANNDEDRDRSADNADGNADDILCKTK